MAGLTMSSVDFQPVRGAAALWVFGL